MINHVLQVKKNCCSNSISISVIAISFNDILCLTFKVCVSLIYADESKVVAVCMKTMSSTNWLLSKLKMLPRISVPINLTLCHT